MCKHSNLDGSYEVVTDITNPLSSSLYPLASKTCL